MAAPESMPWYERLVAVDRRVIYIVLAVAVLLPVVVKIPVKTSLSPEVRAVHSFVDALRPGDVLYLAIDYDPSAMAELQPMAEAILRQALERDARVILTALSQNGPGMAAELVERISGELGKQRDQDWCFLGYKPYPAITILAMGSDFRVPFPTDYYGTSTDQIPMMRDVRNYDDVAAVISVGAGNIAEFWLQYGQAKYGMKLALGVTGVMASDYYPYLQSGQLFGLIPGGKGAAEYEQLVGRLGDGSRYMPFQVTTHLVILAFIVLSNVGYVAQRRARARMRTR